DKFGGLVHFFDRLAAIGAGDDQAVMPGGAIADDLVPELFSVSIEEPDHNKKAYNTARATDHRPFRESPDVSVTSVRSLTFESSIWLSGHLVIWLFRHDVTR